MKGHTISIKVRYRYLVSPPHQVPIPTSSPLQADHTIELNDEALSTGTLLAVTGTHHAHSEKSTGRIGEAFPDAGYGAYY